MLRLHAQVLALLKHICLQMYMCNTTRLAAVVLLVISDSPLTVYAIT
jgi:hypothetical protein